MSDRVDGKSSNKTQSEPNFFLVKTNVLMLVIRIMLARSCCCLESLKYSIPAMKALSNESLAGVAARQKPRIDIFLAEHDLQSQMKGMKLCGLDEFAARLTKIS